MSTGATARAIAACACLAVLAAGCGDSGDGDSAADAPTSATAPAPSATEAEPTPTDVPSPVGDPAAGEASPEAAPEGEGDVSELAEGDEAAVRAAFESYIRALNAGDGAAVCAAFASRSLALRELPAARGGCAAALDASIGRRRPGGVPAWRRTEVIDVTAVSVGDDEARVTATVTHEFADRDYTSVEEDVVYLRESGGRWLLAKPSATFYRAVGFPEPPLRALAPPG